MPRTLTGLLAAAALTFAGCGAEHHLSMSPQLLRTPIDVPAAFVMDPQAPAAPPDAGSAEGARAAQAKAEPAACRSPLFDARDGTRIILVQSSSGLGDYTVPTGHYGVEQHEVLRIDCATGRAIGIFPYR